MDPTEIPLVSYSLSFEATCAVELIIASAARLLSLFRISPGELLYLIDFFILIIIFLFISPSNSGDTAFTLAIRQHIPRLIAELPSFASYANEFLSLIHSLSILPPIWSESRGLFAHLLRLLLSQLDALAEHPRRELYKAILVCILTYTEVAEQCIFH